jgi:hypothetical protein
MFASMSTIRGDDPDLEATARIVGDTMLTWLGEFDGYSGLMILTNEESGLAQVITFWESEEAAERSKLARLKMRDQMTATVQMEVVSTEPYAVAVDDRV